MDRIKKIHLMNRMPNYEYAWRGARYYDKAVPMRDLAALMGHDILTHTKYYGQWTTDEDIKESVLRAVGDLAKA